MRQSPRAYGQERTRWTLALLVTAVVWLHGLTPSGVQRLLQRCGIRYRRGQEQLHSPDPDYRSKVAAINKIRSRARRSRGRIVLLYLDEHTYYRRPSVARCYAPRGGLGKPARQGHGSNTKRRIVGALDATRGALLHYQASRIGVTQLIQFYRQIEQAYPHAEEIYVAQDNWPVHYNPRILEALAGSRIRLLWLPTYAPWTNPAEKVWRKLKQEVLHQHEFGANWQGLVQAVSQWLERTAKNPKELRRYTGLAPRRRKTSHR